MSSKGYILSSVPTVSYAMLALAMLFTSTGLVAAVEETAAAPPTTTSGDKMSSANGSGPPRRFHAIFQGSSAAAAELKSSSSSSLEKMLAGSSRSVGAVDNSTNDNGSNHKNRSRQCRQGCLGKVIIISLSDRRGRGTGLKLGCRFLSSR